ncbi:MAG TPA: flagellar hook-associated protein FlgL [Burkholderiaceae bacterium]|nr:flagellar hook-associated protein FlgL [Burkholderiaceae bacterium]
MRVPSASAFDRQVEVINQRRAEIARSQEQLSSGSRLTRLADDPAAAAQAERNRSQSARLAAEQRMVDHAKSMLQQAEGTVGSAIDELQNVRENLVRAGNGTLSDADRVAIAQQLRGSYEQLLSIANRSDGAGSFVFAGGGSAKPPFEIDGQVVYTAQPGVQTGGTDPELTITQDGNEAFMSVGTAGGVTSVFKLITDAVALLENGDATAAELQAGFKAGIDGMDAGIDRLQAVRTRIGENLRSVDIQTELNGNQSDNLAARLSELVDVDYAKAISDFTTQQTALDAALKTYAQVARMTLFSYL